MKKVIYCNPSVDILFDRVAPTNEVLRERLLTGIVHFAFTKKDGSVREAYGTLQKERIVGFETAANESQNKTQNPNLGVYFDLEANAWRSYTIANLIAIY